MLSAIVKYCTPSIMVVGGVAFTRSTDWPFFSNEKLHINESKYDATLASPGTVRVSLSKCHYDGAWAALFVNREAGQGFIYPTPTMHCLFSHIPIYSPFPTFASIFLTKALLSPPSTSDFIFSKIHSHPLTLPTATNASALFIRIASGKPSKRGSNKRASSDVLICSLFNCRPLGSRSNNEWSDLKVSR